MAPEFKRLTALGPVLIVLISLASVAPAAADVTEETIRFLERQGYRIDLVERTWLGRIRIEASKAGVERELVFNRTTGEILRDHVEREDDVPEGGGEGLGRLLDDFVDAITGGGEGGANADAPQTGSGGDPDKDDQGYGGDNDGEDNDGDDRDSDDNDSDDSDSDDGDSDDNDSDDNDGGDDSGGDD